VTVFAEALAKGPAALWAASAVVAALFAVPFAYLVARSLSLGGDLWDTLASSRTRGPLVRSLALATSVAAAAAVVGTLTAWLTVRTDLPGRRVWRLLLPLPLVIPSFVGAAALLAAFAPGGLLSRLGFDALPRIDGFRGAFAVLVLLTYPYVLLPVSARLAQLPPSLEESARLLGRSPRQVARTVVLPQCAGAIWAGALLVFLYVLSDFGAVQLLRYDTLTRAIYSARLFDRTTSLTLSLLLGVLALAVVVAERETARRRSRFEVATSAGRPMLVRLGRWKALATAVVAAVVGVALAAPVAVLAYWAWRGLTQGTTAAGALSAAPGRLLDPALNTVGASVVTAVVAVVIVLPVAYLTARHRGAAASGTNAVVVAGFALPGLVVALALAVLALQAPAALGLYQSMTLLVFAYVAHFGAQSLRAAQVAVAAVPRRLDDAARMLGAGRARRFATVDLPLMVPGLLAGGGLVLLSTMKELPATLLLAPPDVQTLATRVWQATEDGLLADASLASLVLVALSGVLTWLLVVRRQEIAL
jgi:iron(III) transport system permease protein